ncbi:tyrosine-type recombinase/integrase [Rhodopirellula europaea]|uniref:tyrosine-type recombinase/integrase n=1 Tax=Rhodopirellula europaea TaxID=1263866 RepID=UPI003D2D7F9A
MGRQLHGKSRFQPVIPRAIALLVEPKPVLFETDRFCNSFFERHIKERAGWSTNTKANYRQATSWFARKFSDDRLLTSVTNSEFESWHRWMIHEDRLAQATANKHAKRIRTLFREAIKSRLLTANPGDGYKIGGEACRDRDHYVTRENAAGILSACDTEWALIFGLCRFAGLRCPSEVTGLLWSDVQWAESRLRIDSTKTGLRFAPIFPELRPLLDAAWDHAAEGAKYVIGRHRDNESNLRTNLTRIIERAGLVPWPKPFVNLRASCRTDLEERFPSHVVDAWLGHSTKVARKHYLQVTEAHHERAVTELDPNQQKLAETAGGVTGGVIPADQGQSGDHCESDEPRKTRALMLADYPRGSDLYPRQDSNL